MIGHPLFTWTDTEVIPPTMEGMEYTMEENRHHYELSANKLHFALDENLMHYTMRDEE